MIRHIKLLSIFICLTLVFTISCKENKTQIDKINKQNITIAKQENTMYNWRFLTAFTLDNSTTEISNSKFENLKFKIIKDSIFIENIGKEALYKGNTNSKKYFNRIYDYEYLKRFLSDKFNIKIKNSLIYLRNKNSHKKTSILKNYFDDAFIIDNLLFLMSEENIIVFTDGSILKNSPDKENNKNLQQKNKLIKSDDELLINKLPFTFEAYYKNNFPEKTYPNYTASNILKKYLVTKDYNGDNFDCYLLPPIHNLNVLLISILRGDSTYFIILTYNSNKIIDMAEIGSIGNEDKVITFDINKKYIIKKYRGFKTNKVFIEKLKIDDLGNIIKL